MVPGHDIVSGDHICGSGSTGGLVCNILQQQASPVCRAKPGPSSCSCGQLKPGLEPMAENLPLSSLQHLAEGSREAEVVSGHGCPGGSSVGQQQLVPSPEGIESDGEMLFQSQVVPRGTRKDYLRRLISDDPPSYVDFLALVYSRCYGPDVVSYLLKSHRETTLRQYNSVWQQWIGFLKTQNPSDVTQNTFLSFLAYIFKDRNRQPSTVASYRSALKLPLQWGFNIRVDTDTDSLLSRAFRNVRPSVPAPIKISWSLDKVLAYLVSESAVNFSIKFIQHKAVFLLALASGARASELAALSRDEKWISFNEDGSLLLRPDPSFLAKNELPAERWNPWSIPALEGDDKALCPVQSLRDYLEATSSAKTSSLFLNQIGSKALSTANISSILCQVIKAGDKDSFPSGHDVRKVASSLAFFRGMELSALSRYTGWRSRGVFTKHYCTRLNELKLSCVSAGRQVRPQERTRDPD